MTWKHYRDPLMSTTYEPAAETSKNNPVSTRAVFLIGTLGVGITAGWVLFLFFVVPALMK